jgi:hypothetical protein
MAILDQMGEVVNNAFEEGDSQPPELQANTSFCHQLIEAFSQLIPPEARTASFDLLLDLEDALEQKFQQLREFAGEAEAQGQLADSLLMRQSFYENFMTGELQVVDDHAGAAKDVAKKLVAVISLFIDFVAVATQAESRGFTAESTKKRILIPLISNLLHYYDMEEDRARLAFDGFDGTTQSIDDIVLETVRILK